MFNTEHPFNWKVEEDNYTENLTPRTATDVDTSGLRYGYSFDTIPLKPDVSAFRWPAVDLSCKGPPADIHLTPTPSIPAPDGWVYPQASVFELVEDERYLRRYVARTSFDPTTTADLIRRQCVLKTPPIPVELTEAGYTLLPIPGCIRARPGYSYCEAINGDSTNTITIAASHTLKSLKDILSDDLYLELERRAIGFACNMWGCPASDERAATPAFYTLPGLKRNDRSAKDYPEGSYEGSYSIATTVGKGDGQGCVLPAAQIDNPEARMQIREMLSQLAFMGRIVLRATLSRFESSVTDFHLLDNNVMSYGDSGPYLTSAQVNISAGIRDLAITIGKIQGKWHPDPVDDPSFWTVATLLFRLPPGKSIAQVFSYPFRC